MTTANEGVHIDGDTAKALMGQQHIGDMGSQMSQVWHLLSHPVSIVKEATEEGQPHVQTTMPRAQILDTTYQEVVFLQKLMRTSLEQASAYQEEVLHTIESSAAVLQEQMLTNDKAVLGHIHGSAERQMHYSRAILGASLLTTACTVIGLFFRGKSVVPPYGQSPPLGPDYDRYQAAQDNRDREKRDVQEQKRDAEIAMLQAQAEATRTSLDKISKYQEAQLPVFQRLAFQMQGPWVANAPPATDETTAMPFSG